MVWVVVIIMVVMMCTWLWRFGSEVLKSVDGGCFRQENADEASPLSLRYRTETYHTDITPLLCHLNISSKTLNANIKQP